MGKKANPPKVWAAAIAGCSHFAGILVSGTYQSFRLNTYLTECNNPFSFLSLVYPLIFEV